MANAPDPAIVFGLSLITEMYTAGELMTFDVNRTLDPDWHTGQAGSAFTCLASGVERILKLTYGASLMDAGQAFPDREELRA